MRRPSLLLLGCLLASAGLRSAQASAADCPGNPDALGTSRTIVVDPTEHPRIGTMQYNETLPLNDHEVVLTFDDGPLPAHTNPILDILAAQCVKATFFMVGRMAQVYPQDVRRVYDAGHSIGTHSQNHPFRFGDLPPERMTAEIEDAITNVGNALGDPTKVSPFFRIPGLRRANAVETYLGSRGIMTWSADFPADDWRHITSAQVVHYALSRLEAKGKGILLLHDIQARTQAALPVILRELKARGYRIVHVVAATPAQPKTVTDPAQWIPHWMHGAVARAKGPAPGFTFGAVENPARGPRSVRSVWLAQRAPRARASTIAVLMPAKGRFQINRDIGAMRRPGPTPKTAAHRPLPGSWPVTAGDMTFRPLTGPVKTGSRTDQPATPSVR
ncbi:polysaccharide deacetylase family protein [Bradyrhizobium sp. SYSU BS000235]|uniref:polysaccharide deacetylase family protein n=1 Tax=Bradyrhizobium sp. SYSU BS000235 TaxID=3411332 RepID=UPI003C76480D